MSETKLAPGSWQEGPWVIHGKKTVFENPWLALETYPVTMPNTGEAGNYGVVRFHNIAVGVLPLDEEGNTWLVGQHRFPLNTYSWELPEGGGAKNVDTEHSARRELEEEIGIRAEHLAIIGEWDLSNSVTDERAVAYIATDLSQGQMMPDPSEVLEIKKLPFQTLVEQVMKGDIRDSFTVLMVQTALLKAQRGELPANIARLLLPQSEK